VPCADNRLGNEQRRNYREMDIDDRYSPHDDDQQRRSPDDRDDHARYDGSGDENDAHSRGDGEALPPTRRSAPLSPVRPAASRSLAMRIINRRRAMRDPGKAITRSIVTSIISVIGVFVIVSGGIGAGYAYAKTQQYAAVIASLGLSQALQTSRIYDRHGQLLYQTFGQNSSTREYLDYCEIPMLMQQATIDTEDNSYWQNPGINVGAILRSVFLDFGHGGTVAGGSTITQQLVKNAVLGDSQQNVQRKIDEAILALDVTQHYSKQDILTMYLNSVTYGYNYEGIETAADNFFHLHAKTVLLTTTDPQEKAFLQQYTQCMKDENHPLPKAITESAAYQLQPWQATILAGTPNNPNVYNPYIYPQAANDRQCTNVLTSMANDGDSKYLYTVDPTTGATTQVSAQELCQYTLQKLMAKDKSGNPINIFPNRYAGASAQYQKLAPYFVDYVINQLSAYFPDGVQGFDTAGWNVYTTLDYGDPSITTAQISSLSIDVNSGKLVSSLPNTGNWVSRVGLEQYGEYLVTRYITQDFPDYWYCGSSLAHPDNNRAGGDYTSNPFAPYNWCWETPLNGQFTNVHDGALTAVDPKTGDILAMVGGVNYNSIDKREGGQFNTPVYANRSLGSSFKPIVYATAFQMGWNPGVIINDQPTCFPVGGSINITEESATDAALCPGNYLPHNYTKADWAGPQPITYLLGNSLNTPAEMALSYVGLSATDSNPLLSMAQRLGINSLQAKNIGPATAIGTQPVPLLQETSAYGTFAANGYHYVPRAVLQVLRADGSSIMDQNGHVLFAYTPTSQGYQAISPQAAYMVTSILINNHARYSDFGVFNPLYFQGRDVAAKTGTSDSLQDIVTVGYTPWLSIGVWAGNADSESATNIIGIAGAGYIFHDLMAFAIDRLNMPGTLPSKNSPQLAGGYFPIPTGIHRAILNCQDGLAPWKGMNVTDPKTACNPHAQDRPAAAISTEFDWCPADGKISPPYPNETKHCYKQITGTNDPGWDKSADQWSCLNWGCPVDASAPADTGQDIAWVVDGQDPTQP
jgi:membrane peptidoglycan carboxypeptidase